MTEAGEQHSRTADGAQRRSFLVRAAATIIGGVVVVFPFLAGMGVLLDPLFRRRPGGQDDRADDGDSAFVRIGPLDLLPEDGTPRQFAVSADVTNAWTRAGGQRIGAVFVRRVPEGDEMQVAAFSTTCPHLGCAVDYDADENHFECPCHASGFALDGSRLFGPSLRGLDPLEAKVIDRDGTAEVCVAFLRFRTGVAERIPVG